MHAHQLPYEQFPELSALPLVRHAFTTRASGIDVHAEKATVLERLDLVHRQIRETIGLADSEFCTTEQVHGNVVAVLSERSASCSKGADGLVTNQVGVCLGIYVADCCAAYLVDPVKRAIGLVHSGRKGTELRIVEQALRTMVREFETDPADVIAQLSPCIRPPHYETDFAQQIRRQLRDAGVVAVHDAMTCTACDLPRYYSYRAEKGRTGRMLALLSLELPQAG